MNNLNDMWPKCQRCTYWQLCDPPYICSGMEEKLEQMEMEAKSEQMEAKHVESGNSDNSGGVT